MFKRITLEETGAEVWMNLDSIASMSRSRGITSLASMSSGNILFVRETPEEILGVKKEEELKDEL